MRPRPYQTVPMLMALRQETVRLMVSDDVGVGKSIEAALIARELLDRGEVRRVCVLCPPHLCDQWQQELAEKFHIDAEVVRSGTAAQLERRLPPGDHSIFGYYQHLVVSMDYAKSDRHRHSFLLHCPELVIVDEVHTCAKPAGRHVSQQQRHELLVDLTKRLDRHLVLLTATPHSGIEESFLSLLGLLKPEFAELNFESLSEGKREELARHFIQRTRADVKAWLGEITPFPDRDPKEVPYAVSEGYGKLFNDIYAFARELVQSVATLTGFRQRVRYWTALALLRCVMSSPAAAEAALLARAQRLADKGGAAALEDLESEAEDRFFAPYVYDPTEAETNEDVAPTHIVDEGETTMPDTERRRLREFARRATVLKGEADEKVACATREVEKLLKDGFHPIVYCRYIATADYVAEELRKRLNDGGVKGRKGERATPLSPVHPFTRSPVHVSSVTGARSEDERRALVAELGQSTRRVLVATDCLSEGINLQERFTAVVHYDLPWNPNRLEQREGRVDRFGQPAPQVKTVLLYGRDNPVDGVVLDVLIRKAVQIHKTLGISVPIPVNSETVMEAVLKALFMRGKSVTTEQLTLDLETPTVAELHEKWERAAERESRSRFAQRSIHPDDVQRELVETDAVLGDVKAVEQFVRAGCERLGAPLTPGPSPTVGRAARGEGVWKVDLAALPVPVRERMDIAAVSPPGRRRAANAGEEILAITFDTPVPEGVTYIGRNHPFTAALADYLLDCAFDTTNAEPPASRSGVIRTDAVQRRTTLLLLRIRFLLETKRPSPTVGRGDGGERTLLAEELVVFGVRGSSGEMELLEESDALRLLTEATPTENVAPPEAARLLQSVEDLLPALAPRLEAVAHERATRLLDAHRRVRRLTDERLRGFTVRPHLPVDVLGMYVYVPVPQGVRKDK
ncbi:MAG: DEAD/DEAH box helicase [Armatimonadetes bacterium]|nr:DEAD/DEAH box helicase [Armatimonadota bacterium]